MDFFTDFTREKTPQNNISSQNFSVENNYLLKAFSVKKQKFQPIMFILDIVDQGFYEIIFKLTDTIFLSLLFANDGNEQRTIFHSVCCY